MRPNAIINRYILMELLPPFGVNLFFFTFIFLISKLLEITNLVVNYHVSLVSFLLLLLYSIPFFLAFITPMSVMMAVLLTFLRMSGDNEIMALKSCGLNPHRFLFPVLVFCFMGWLLTTFITVVGLPWGNRSYYGLSVNMAQTHIDAVIKERTFIDSFDGMTLYVNKVNLQDRSLEDLFIDDQRDENIHITIVAPKGQIISDQDNKIIWLKLYNGSINQVDIANRVSRTTTFKTHEKPLDLKQAMTRKTGKSQQIDEMTLSQLKRFLKESPQKNKYYYKAMMKWHEKFALPMACFALGLIALPLGMQVKRGKRSSGTITGIFMFLFYYILLSVGWSFGESGTVPPMVGMWAPNVVMGSLGIYLYFRWVKDRPVQFQKLAAVLKFGRWLPGRLTKKP